MNTTNFRKPTPWQKHSARKSVWSKQIHSGRIRSYFASLSHIPGEKSGEEGSMSSAGKLAILVGGGPAPGINAVISSATIKAINEGFEVLGVQDGFKWLVRRDATKARPLSIDDVSRIHLRGGSILGTARENPTRSEETMRAVIDTLKQHRSEEH